MTHVRLAVVQSLISADPRENGATIRAAMDFAAKRGCRLVQFPEGALSGYAKEQVHSWDDVERRVVEDELRRVLALARVLRIWVVLGSAHWSSEEDRPYNSLYVISDDGAVVDRYDKRICSHTEASHYYASGTEPVVVEVDGVRFGCLVCIEVNFPELVAAYQRDGVDGVLLSAYPVDAVLSLKARALAAIFTCWVGVASPAQARDLVRAEVFGPDGGRCGTHDGDMVVCDIDLQDPAYRQALELARPWRRKVRDDLGEPVV